MPTRLSVVIPTLNECGNIGTAIDMVGRYLGTDVEVIVVDGGSTDCTVAEATEASRKNGLRLKVIRQKTCCGKPGALIDGFKEAQGDYVAVIDADMEFHPKYLAALYEQLQGADLVLGYRRDKRPIHRRIISSGARLLAKIAIPKTRKLKDPTTELYIFRRELACVDKMKPRIKPILEILAKCNFSTTKEIEIEQTYRAIGQSKFKISWIFNYLYQLGELTDWFTVKYIAVALAAGIVAGLLSPYLGLWAVAVSILGRWAPLRKYVGLPQIAAAELASIAVKYALAYIPAIWFVKAAVELLLIHILRR